MPAKPVYRDLCPAGRLRSRRAQQTSQVQLKIEPANRTLTVTADEQVTVDPDVAILHIGFQTQPSDAKSAYAAGAQTSNDIVDALKQAGIPEARFAASGSGSTAPTASRTSSPSRSSGR